MIPSMIPILSDEDYLDILLRMSRSIPTRDRIIVKWRLIKGMSFEEIAEKLHLPLKKTRKRYNLAYGRLSGANNRSA